MGLNNTAEFYRVKINNRIFRFFSNDLVAEM